MTFETYDRRWIMNNRILQLPLVILFSHLFSSFSIADEYSIKQADTILYFDQPQSSIEPLYFKHDDELKPVANDFRIVKASYLSNKIGGRWAVVTFENKSSGQRLLKNEAVVATFADGFQTNAHNLNEILKGSEQRTISVFFGNQQFPIVSVKVD